MCLYVFSPGAASPAAHRGADWLKISKMLEIFYQSATARPLFFSVVCWGGGTSASATSRLSKLIKRAGFVIGCRQETFEVVGRRMLNQLFLIMDNQDRAILHTPDRQRRVFSKRPRQLCRLKEHFLRSFLPRAITLYNSSLLCDRYHFGHYSQDSVTNNTITV